MQGFDGMHASISSQCGPEKLEQHSHSYPSCKITEDNNVIISEKIKNGRKKNRTEGKLSKSHVMVVDLDFLWTRSKFDENIFKQKNVLIYLMI